MYFSTLSKGLKGKYLAQAFNKETWCKILSCSTQPDSFIKRFIEGWSFFLLLPFFFHKAVGLSLALLASLYMPTMWGF